jgi:integrase
MAQALPEPASGKRPPRPASLGLPGTVDHPLTDAQLAALLLGGDGGADPDVRDAVAILALSGLRFDELRHLRGRDCGRGAFRVGACTANRGCAREVPLHSALVRTIIRRTRGHLGNVFLFRDGAQLDGWPSPLRRRFDIRREAVGVVGPACGIHCLRCWFVRAALAAEQPPRVIATVIGHLRPDDAPPEWRPRWGELCACVESVRLPVAIAPGEPA